MVKIPTYARQHIPQATGTPGVDPNAGRDAAAIADVAGRLGEVVAQQRDIADQATAAKLSAQAAIDLEGQTAELRTLHANDPEKLTSETQRMYQEYYAGTGDQISNTRIRNKYLAQGNSAMSAATVGNMKWSIKTMNERAKVDFEEARIGARVGLGNSSDADTFTKNARVYSTNNKELYTTIYGDEGLTKLKQDWSDGAEKFMQSQVSQNPFKAFQEIESGKLDDFMSTAEKQKWTTRAKDGINTWDKNLVTKAKSSAVVRGSELGAKVQNNTFTAGDIEGYYNSIKDSPSIPQETKDATKVWMDQVYAGVKLPLGMKLENFDGQSKELTDLTKFVKDNDADVSMPAILRHQAKITDMMNNGKLTQRAFTDLYSQSKILLDKTAAEINGTVGETWRKAGVSINITTQAYERIDSFIEGKANTEVFKNTPKGYKDRVGLDMKINYNRLVVKREKEKGRELTGKEYLDVMKNVRKSAVAELNNNIFNPVSKTGER